ncbi:MAG: hypothetical protein ACPGR2_07895 [Psychrobium sp.]
MTAQIPETIEFENKKQMLLTCPLEDYFTLGKVDSPFNANCSALWRGYIGHWKIINGRLYLISVEPQFDEENTTVLGDIFPGFDNCVFAHWYSGELRIASGKEVEFAHAGFGSVYAREVFLSVEEGVLVSTRVAHHK